MTQGILRYSETRKLQHEYNANANEDTMIHEVFQV